MIENKRLIADLRALKEDLVSVLDVAIIRLERYEKLVDDLEKMSKRLKDKVDDHS